jgi:predicted RNA-binding protein
MCEASAYIIDGDKQELIMEAVDSVEPEDNGYKLVNIFGEQKFIKGTIYSLSLVEHKIRCASAFVIQRRVSVPHSSILARLEFGTFPFAI